jgi:hypothetical protein
MMAMCAQLAATALTVLLGLWRMRLHAARCAADHLTVILIRRSLNMPILSVYLTICSIVDDADCGISAAVISRDRYGHGLTHPAAVVPSSGADVLFLCDKIRSIRFYAIKCDDSLRLVSVLHQTMLIRSRRWSQVGCRVFQDADPHLQCFATASCKFQTEVTLLNILVL